MTLVLAALVFLAGIIGAFLGVVCLFSPRAARVTSRWYAIPLLLSLVGSAGLGIILDPSIGVDPSAKNQSVEETRQAGILLLGLWLMLLWLSRFLARPDEPKKKGLFSRMADGFKAELKKVEEQQAAEKARKEAQKRQQQDQAEKARRIVEEREFNARRAGAAAAKLSIPEPKKKSKPTKLRIIADPSAPRFDGGDVALFIYVDADGEVTDRQVLNWQSDNTYLTGFCTTRRAPRKFRLDRIDTWISG